MEIEGGRFLVSGGAGFIGANLVETLLKSGAEQVVIYDNFLRGTLKNVEEAIKDPRTVCIKDGADLRDLNSIQTACERMDGVFHLASLCLGQCQKQPREGLDINVIGTYNLLEACVNTGVKRIMFASSSSVYGNAVYSPMDETHPFRNKNFYGATKIAGEAIIHAFYHAYGLEHLNFRFMNVYGPKQDYEGVYVAVIIKIIDRINQGLPPIIYGNGEQTFDFVYVDDACNSLLLGMESDITTEALNISSGIPTSIKELAEIILNIMDSDLPIEYHKQDETTLVVDRLGSRNKAEEMIGFTASTTLKNGIQKVIDWKLSKN